MVLPGHLAGGYLTATAVLTLFHPEFSAAQIHSLLILGTLAGELPDIDLFFFNWKHRRDKIKKYDVAESENHRNYITHVPIFWLVISLVIVGIGFIFQSIFTQYVGWIILGGTLIHLIFDSIEYGIRWFGPWSKKRYALIKIVPHEYSTDRPGSLMQYTHFLIRTYWKTWTFRFEIIITFVALIVLFKSF